MKLVTRTNRVFAVLLGIALLITVVVQILRDNRNLELKRIGNFQPAKR